MANSGKQNARKRFKTTYRMRVAIMARCTASEIMNIGPSCSDDEIFTAEGYKRKLRYFSFSNFRAVTKTLRTNKITLHLSYILLCANNQAKRSEVAKMAKVVWVHTRHALEASAFVTSFYWCLWGTVHWPTFPLLFQNWRKSFRLPFLVFQNISFKGSKQLLIPFAPLPAPDRCTFRKTFWAKQDCCQLIIKVRKGIEHMEFFKT